MRHDTDRQRESQEVQLFRKRMKFQHRCLEFEIDDDWLIEADVIGFRASLESYEPSCPINETREVFSVRFEEVEPLRERARKIGVFCDSVETGETAKKRVMRILVWLRDGTPIDPVKVVRTDEEPFKFKLVEGSHRFHCALALGFTAIPAVLGVDMAALNA